MSLIILKVEILITGFMLVVIKRFGLLSEGICEIILKVVLKTNSIVLLFKNALKRGQFGHSRIRLILVDHARMVVQ